MKSFFALLLIVWAQTASADWFEHLKKNGSAEDLYRTLYYMPKGGDLHNHLAGAAFSEWWYDLAFQQKKRGYEYYTKVRINNCVPYGGNEYSGNSYYLMFGNITRRHYESLDDCQKLEYKRLEDLNADEKTAWIGSLRLDKPYEGRDEFFGNHWSRLSALERNPWIQAELLYLNMKAFGDEGVTYLELQVFIKGFRDADDNVITPEETTSILIERLKQKDALETGVTVRFQISLMRFTPDAENSLREIYKFVYEHNDMFVAVNMVGREDNDKGYPARFLETLRDLRRQYSGVKLSIHAGEVDEPNYHVRDTLLLGADRIGHGVNLITDDDTMRLMRHGPYLVEINLISNLLLNYVSDYSLHPFPEYLRTGVPVALSTDDRGAWDSTMTDEFYVAVKEFNLTWDEIKLLSRNSLQHAFVSPAIRLALLEQYNDRVEKFERSMNKNDVANLGPMPETRRFICSHYELCN